MNKLSRRHLLEKAAHQEALAQARATLEVEVNAFNESLTQARTKVEAAQEALNERVREAKEWCDGVQDDAQQAYDARSERWREGDAGQEYAQWLEALSPDLPEVELEFPEDLEPLDDDHADLLDQVPDEPGAG